MTNCGLGVCWKVDDVDGMALVCYLHRKVEAKGGKVSHRLTLSPPAPDRRASIGLASNLASMVHSCLVNPRYGGVCEFRGSVEELHWSRFVSKSTMHATTGKPGLEVRELTPLSAALSRITFNEREMEVAVRYEVGTSRYQ